MAASEGVALLLLSLLLRAGVDGAPVHAGGNETALGAPSDKIFFGGEEERNLEREILRELDGLGSRQQREIFQDLEKQNERFDASRRSWPPSETDAPSPLNVEELESVRKTIKASNASLPTIRSKRTLNFLLTAVARAMGYTLTPTNPDAEWVPRQQQPSAQPCTPAAPPCGTNPPPSTPAPCAPPSTPPPCGSAARLQRPTVPPARVDANTISYPFRPARTIPLFNFAPLPQGIRVPYPPLLQPLAQSSPCGQPPPPCGATPPPCAPAPPPSSPPCTPTPAPCPSSPAPPPPCGTQPPSAPPPCGTTPAPRPPPCGTTPAPPPCATTPAPPPPCPATPAPKPPPCGSAPPAPPPCGTTPAPPPPCGNPPPPPPPPPSAQPPKKGSILLEYEDPVRIQIFSNDKKYLPASGSVYSGLEDGHEGDLHSYFFPGSGANKQKDEDVEEEEEEEHIEAEEEEGGDSSGAREDPALRHHEDQDERGLALDEEDESETSLSVVKKPADLQKVRQRGADPSKAQNSPGKPEKGQKMKKPKRKKWVRIVKKQRRKTKTDSGPRGTLEFHASDSLPEGSRLSGKIFGRPASYPSFDSRERDFDFDHSGSHSSEDVSHELRKVTISRKDIRVPEPAREARRFEIDVHPYAPEPEGERRKKLEKAVEKYVEDFIEKQLGDELVKNTGIPKTTVFEFAPKNGPKIQTVTTTVAKTTRTGGSSKVNPPIRRETRPATRVVKKSPEGNVSHEAFFPGP